MSFPQMCKVVPEGEKGLARVRHFEISEFDAGMSAIRDRWMRVDPGKYARLTVDGRLFMSDTRMERITNGDFVRQAHGRVLIAGLGLGMILHRAFRRYLNKDGGWMNSWMRDYLKAEKRREY